MTQKQEKSDQQALHDPNAPAISAWAWYQEIVQSLPGMSNTHSSSQKTPVYDDIRLLGALLGKVVATEGPDGPDQFLLIEDLRRAAKRSHEQGHAETLSEVTAIVERLSSGSSDSHYAERLLKAVDAFRIFLELASIAESYHQNCSLSHPEHVVQSISAKLREGVSAKDIKAALEKTNVRLVSTAHPTQIFRITYLNHHKSVMELLGRFHGAGSYLDQVHVMMELETEIQRLWLTGFVRWVQPGVFDEAKALHSFLDVLYETLPRLQARLDGLMATQGLSELSEPLIRIGSWVGGDMDGNPNTQPHVFAKTLAMRWRRILTTYRDQLHQLTPKYAFSMLKGILPTPMLTESIESDLMAFSRVSDLGFKRSTGIYKYQSREPYRQKLLLMIAKLNHTLSYPLVLNELDETRFQGQYSFVPQPKSVPFVYHSGQELADDLTLVIEGLQENEIRDESLRPLRELLQSIRTFDFYYAGIDLREDAGWVQSAVRCAMHARGYDLSFLDPAVEMEQTSEQWAEFLEQQLLLAAPSAIQPLDVQRTIQERSDEFSEAGVHEKRLFGMLSVMKLAQDEIHPEASSYLLLSMTHRVSDILAALYLLKLQNLVQLRGGKLKGHVDIVPLFETIDDLRRAPAMMARLFESNVYRDYLASRNNRQVILMAYSDSNKDGGYFTSQWNLYQAQKQILNVAEEHGVTIQFYHGRGGSIGRGGGPTKQHILSLPAHSLDGGVQITEQGEVLARYYLVPETAETHLNNLVSASMARNLTDDATIEAKPKWLELSEQLSSESFEKYRRLKQLPGFVDYFKYATPREIETIHIGSRPAHRRKESTIEDLRAIPWVFRWFQSRTILPGWYGLGTALKHVADETPDGLANIQQMYTEWAFFRGLLDNSALTVVQSNMQIARHYATLLADAGCDESQMSVVYDDIAAEYALTEAMLKRVTDTDQLLMDGDMRALGESIGMKQIYLDPLNYLQVYLLKQFRQEAESSDEQIRSLFHRAFISSTGGIVAGLGTSG